jgi:uncharacterized protein (DUF433 family)
LREGFAMGVNTEPVVVRTEGVLGGRPIFRGTRVQVETLFENLADGHSLDEIIENFPTLDRSDLRSPLIQACEALKESAPLVETQPKGSLPRARVSR